MESVELDSQLASSRVPDGCVSLIRRSACSSLSYATALCVEVGDPLRSRVLVFGQRWAREGRKWCFSRDKVLLVIAEEFHCDCRGDHEQEKVEIGKKSYHVHSA